MGYIGITMGDPAGIGAEVLLKALADESLANQSIIFGSVKVIEYYASLQNIKVSVNILENVDEFKEGMLNIVDVVDLNMDDFKVGEVSKICGDASYHYIFEAIKKANDGDIDAVVTGPINKESLNLAGHNFAGHTEIFAHLTETEKYAMVLWSTDLKVIHVSTHVSLRDACDRVTRDRVCDVIRLAHETLLAVKKNKPRIGVAGLNPHAGETGLFGDEEINEIGPAIEQCKTEGIEVTGPYAPDTVFLDARDGKFDMVVVMYHDQGHIPIKLLAFDTGINMTVGLPIIRTSVDHGTAFNIAGQNIASERSMIESLKLAIQLSTYK